MNNLYQDGLKVHYSNPTGQNRKIDVTHRSEGYNASCGDEIWIELQLNENTIDDISFESDSCAICTASASILCEFSKHHDRESIQSVYRQLRNSLNQDLTSNDGILLHPQLEILQAISQYPSRINCALLPWQTAKQAFDSPIPKIRDLTSNA